MTRYNTVVANQEIPICSLTPNHKQANSNTDDALYKDKLGLPKRLGKDNTNDYIDVDKYEGLSFCKPLCANFGDNGYNATSNDWLPQRLINGKWACSHSCKQKLSCKHTCCKEGLDHVPKRPKHFSAPVHHDKSRQGTSIRETSKSSPNLMPKPIPVEYLDLSKKSDLEPRCIDRQNDERFSHLARSQPLIEWET